jgi:hypothetical protein
MVTQSLFQHPAGSSNQALMLSMRTQTDKLNQLLQTLRTTVSEQTVDLTDIYTQLEAIELQFANILSVLDDIENNGGLTDEQEFLLSLVTAVDSILGTVPQQVKDTIERSQRAAKAIQKGLLEGRKNAVAIKVEQQARITEQEAFASQVTTLSAQIGLSLGMVNQEIVARADGDTALASSVETVTTALNGNIAQTLLIQESVDGIEGRIGLAINLNGEVVGLVQLDGTASGSNFTVLADNFYVGTTGTSGGDPVPIFAIRTVDGVSKIALRADVYADGDIIARHIAAGTITAAKMAVTDLSAIAANVGTITAGKLQRADATMIVDLDNKRLKISS